MRKESENFNGEVQLLKEARQQILRLHKELIDIERRRFETENRQLSSGEFLQVLLNDENFNWLRRFSMLIVEIDEMFDLSDGYSKGMIEKHFLQLIKMIEFETADKNFNSKYSDAVKTNTIIESKHRELKKLLTKK